MNRNVLKLLTILVLSIYLWTFGGLFSIAHAYKSSQESPVREQPKQKPEGKFQQAIEDIEKTITNTSLDRPTRKARLKSKKEELEATDKEIRKQFADTEKKLNEAGLPGEILRRHYDFVKHYDDNLQRLRISLDALEKAKTDEASDAELGKIREHLKEIKPSQKRKPLDPNKLPHRTREAKKREPRLNEKDFLKDRVQTGNLRKPIFLAANGPLTGILAPTESISETSSIILAQTTSQPTASDLAETIEVQFTPAIRAKAQELGYNPVKIYNWVRNNIEYVPTYGSIQGADMCLQTRQGNDFDIASLLIALLRASDIPARYVYGTIELPIEKVMNWVGGFTNANAAMEFIAAGGVPVEGLISGGKISAVRMEHLWVEAHIDYFPSRGARHKTGQGDAWIPLDASYKQYTYTQGMDIKTAVPFDAQTFVEHIQSSAIVDPANSSVTGVDSAYIQQQLQDYQTQVQDYISQHYPDATAGDVLGKKEIIKQEFPYLLGTLPYKRIVTGAKYAELPDTLRHKITFSVMKDIFDEGAINITKSLPEVAGKKITLSYRPATAQDEAVINSYLPQPHPDGTPIQPSELPTSLPAYLINLKPELRIDGLVAATGTTLGMGSQETFDMVFSEPGPWGTSETVSNRVNSGAYYAVAMDTGKISEAQMLALKARMEATKAKIETNDFTNLTKDDIVGDILYRTALSYYVQLDVTSYMQSKASSALINRWPSESICSFELKVDMMFGIPRQVSGSGIMMDVDRNINIVKAIDGDTNRSLQSTFGIGLNSSGLEHSVPEKMFSTESNPTEGISAVKALKIANDQGIPIYAINRSNINTILPQLQIDENVIMDIQDAVGAGKSVAVSKNNITFNGWTGSGYIIIEPTTSSGAYMISGGLNGAFTFIEAAANIFLLVSISGTAFAAMGPQAYLSNPEPTCVPVFHDDFYWSCVYNNFFTFNIAAYLAGFRMILSPIPIVSILGFVAIISLSTYVANECGKAATYCH